MDLPVESVRSDLLRALRRRPVCLCAPTGSGKSTRVPVWCSEEVGRVLVVEPRRVACRSLARFVASSTGAGLGREVGYVHRHERRAGPDTRIVFATPGSALRMLGAGDVDGCDVVIVDEFHERRLQVDLFLALVRHRLPALALVVMSATLDAAGLAAWLGGRAIEAEGRLHPVRIEHDESVSVPTASGLEDRVAGAVRSGAGRAGDMLVFLPGKAEIAAVARRFDGMPDLDVLPLHGGLGPREQDRAFETGARQRAVLATNVAESAVTLPRIGQVIDSGLERRTVWRDGRSVLELAVISQDSADQRAGRAGRLGPGRALRLWSRAARLEEHTPPEIHRVDLMELVLEAAAAGVPVGGLSFPDPPRPYALDEARTGLRAMRAVDARDAITRTGRSMMRFGLDPPLARILVEAGDADDARLLQDAVDLVAGLSASRDLAGRAGPEELTGEECDLVARILAVRTGTPARHGLRSGPLAEARRTARALRALLGLESLEGPVGSRLALARTIVRALPSSAYVPHRRQGAFGNGRDEVVLARESRAPRGAEALVVVERRSVRRRSRTVTLATCAGPVPLALLVEEGIGEERLVGARREGRDLVGVIERGLAGRVIDRREEIVQGERAAQAAAMVVDASRLTDDVEAWNLAIDLGLVQGEPFDACAWLVERLRELGVSCGADLDLLVPGDLALPGLDPPLRATLDREHPRTLNIGGQVLRATYDVPGRRVTLEPVGGLRTPPSSLLLPPWTGWSVVYVDRGRSRRLR